MKALNPIVALALSLGLLQPGFAGSLRSFSSLSMAYSLVEEESARGGEFRIRLLDDISTESNKAGDSVKARVLSPEVLKGDVLEGKIHYCRKGGKLKGDAVLAFSFNRLVHQGRVFPIKSYIRSVISNEDLQINNEAILSQKNPNLENTGLFALNGAYVGALDGDLKVAGLGAGITAGVYLTWACLSGQKTRITLPQGTELWIDMEDLEEERGSSL
ncbi:MAG: hypothetical protein L0387_28695 [Acidobacteria bacterium]|nr:hypothetical protein [Acidobacteriota bacterium]